MGALTMAWVDQRDARCRVRFRNADGTDSSRLTHRSAELRCKQVDIDQAYLLRSCPRTDHPGRNGWRFEHPVTKLAPPLRRFMVVTLRHHVLARLEDV